MNGLDQIVSDLAGAAQSYLANGITVQVKTNYTPAITVYTGSSGSGQAGQGGASAGGSILSNLIGLQAGVTVTDSGSGRVLATYGPNNGDPPTDWVRVTVALAVIGLIGFGLVKLARAF